MERTTLTDAEIKAIRKQWRAGDVSQRKLASWYKVSNTRINKICNGKARNYSDGWSGVPDYWV